MDFENSADSYDVWLLPDAKKIIFFAILVCWNCIFVGKIVKIWHLFVFKALELLLDGVCRQVSIHVMKLHAIGVLFWLMVYRRQAASRGRNRHLKKKFFEILWQNSPFHSGASLYCKMLLGDILYLGSFNPLFKSILVQKVWQSEKKLTFFLTGIIFRKIPMHHENFIT